MTAYVETMPSGYTRARLNFMNTKNSSSMYGSSSAKDTPVLDQKTYQVAFEHIEEALFERGALTKTAPAAAQAVAQTATPAATVTPTVVSTVSTPASASSQTPPAAAPATAAAATTPPK